MASSDIEQDEVSCGNEGACKKHDHYFSPGIYVYYKSGDDAKLAAKYLGLKSVPSTSNYAKADIHEIWLEYGTKITTSHANLMLLEQPDLTSIPFTVGDFEREVEIVILKEQIASLAWPLKLSPLQQEFL